LLEKPASTAVEPLVEKFRKEFRRWFVSRLEDADSRLAGTRDSIERIAGHLNSLDEGLRGREEKATAKLARALAGVQGNSVPATTSLGDYLSTRLDLVAAQVSRHAVRVLLSDLKAFTDELVALGRELEHIAAGVAKLDGETAASAKDEAIERTLQQHLAELAAEVDGRLAAEFLQGQGLWVTIMQGGRRRAQLCATLNEFARQTAVRALGDANASHGQSAGSTMADLGSYFATATPSLLAQGGSRRVLVLLPKTSASEAAAKQLAEQLPVQPNMMAGLDNNLTICVEASELRISEVAVELVQRRRDRVEFAGRVQSRNDISWTPLVVEPAEAPMSTWVELASTPALPEQFGAKTMVLEQ
jgi:hypothetical protein